MIDLAGGPPAVWEVTSFDSRRASTWESWQRGLRAVASHVIEPAGAGSRVTLAVLCAECWQR